MSTVGKEAKILFFDGDFDYETPGDHVRCSVSGEKISLINLNYWSVSRQEAYVSAQAGLFRAEK